jgi:hypothetical protein
MTHSPFIANDTNGRTIMVLKNSMRYILSVKKSVLTFSFPLWCLCGEGSARRHYFGHGIEADSLSLGSKLNKMYSSKIIFHSWAGVAAESQSSVQAVDSRCGTDQQVDMPVAKRG